MRRVASLLVAAQLCAASRHGFSIHHDLLAYPQFEVVFSDTYISEPEAKALLDPSHVGNEKDIQAARASATAAPESSDGDHKIAETYEIMSMPPNKYLCAIPVIEAPPAQNKTETELAKAEEARELARASVHGWELVNALDGVCLYYASGWWSYSFCYGHDVVQFHALPSKGNKPPQKDPHSQEYVLGRAPEPASTATSRRGRSNKPAPDSANGAKTAAPPPDTELQIKGDQRYLVQRMDDGTICDLTNRPRTIEIQYHCSPGSTQDRIGWIKEVTTCSYLMLVNTPRLCRDVAFQPPPPSRANIISCRTIVPEAEQASWHAQKTLEAKAAMVGQARKNAQQPVTIGGVVVGGRQILGTGEDGKQAAPQLKPPRSFGSSKDALVEIIALGNQDEDGTMTVMTPEDLERLDIDPKLIEQLKRQLEEMAGDKEWKLEITEEPGEPREIRGVIGTDEEDETPADNKKQQQTQGRKDQRQNKAGSTKSQKKGQKGQEKDDEKGSEEKFFKEEL